MFVWKKTMVTNLEKFILDLQKRIDEAQEEKTNTIEALIEPKWKLCKAYRRKSCFGS